MTHPSPPAPGGPPPPAPKSGSVTLGKELSDFLIELSIAMHRHAMYPGGHPSLAPAVETTGRRLEALTAAQGSLSLGVAMDQLVIEGVATDTGNPVLAELSRRLHAHQLGAVTFHPGATVAEVMTFVKRVARDPDRSQEPLGRLDAAERDTEHIHLLPIAYDKLRIMDAPEGEDANREARSRFAQLWVGLAKVAMEEEAGDSADPDAVQDPSRVASAISAHEKSSAYDQVIVGYLLKIADELSTAEGAEALALRKRMADLVAGIDEDTLQRLLNMGGAAAQRQRFLQNAARGLEVDSVVRLITVAARNEVPGGISQQLVRMLQKLANHAESVPGELGSLADASMRDHVSELIGGWSTSNPNPSGYDVALEKIAASAPLFRTAIEQQHAAEPHRLIEMAVELDVVGPIVGRAMRELVHGDDVRWVMDRVALAESDRLSELMRREFGDPTAFAAVLENEPIDEKLFNALLPVVGEAGIEPIFNALITSESRQTRRFLLDRIATFGAAVIPHVRAHLDDDRWYVQRNMLTVLSALPDVPPDLDPTRFLQHDDSRVRREALRLMLQHPNTREKAIGRALADSDERNVRLALAAASEKCPRAVIPLVVTRTKSGPTELRVAAIRVLRNAGDPTALAALLSLTQPKKSAMRWKFPTKTREFLVALHALQAYADDPRAKQILELAARHKDHDLVSAATKQDGRDE